MNQEIVIVAAKRTPMGSFQGALSTVPAPHLAASAIKSALASLPSKIDVNHVIMGCVLPAGLKQAPARQAALFSGLPYSAGATTINKVCGSGMKAVMMACDEIKSGFAEILIAGGMENMSQSPYLLEKARFGMRMGHGKVLDHMFLDGLEDAYDGSAMGAFAQITADERGLTREAMDEYAILSLQRANKAMKNGAFDEEIASVSVASKNGDLDILHDEQPAKARIDKIPTLKPAFAKGGTITAANSSSISDGAAALILMGRDKANALGLKVIASIKGYTSHAQEPASFTTAPVGAISSLLAKLKWHKDSVDLFEINEAFAMVTMLAIADLGLKKDKVNIHGGACALGHPIGCSGARILVTLIHALRANKLKKGVASLCIGGGEAVAMAIEVEA